MKTIKIIIIPIFILNLLAPTLISAQTDQITQPGTLDEAQKMGEKALEVTKTKLPGIINDIWKNEALPIWKKMFDWTRAHIWDNWLAPLFKNLWQSSIRILKSEAEQRKPVVEEEFQKEKESIKEETPTVGKSLWQKFQELIK